MAEEKEEVKKHHPADTNGDGRVSDARRDAMRHMTWFALLGMLCYPAGILITSMLGFESTAKIIGDIAPTYFVAISALVAAYFGANAYADKKK